MAQWWFLGVGEQEGHWEVPKGVQRFTLEDLARATQDFSKEHEIGSGSFGKVFVGSFPNSKSLAIKRASTSTSDNGQMEFRNEVIIIPSLMPYSYLDLSFQVYKEPPTTGWRRLGESVSLQCDVNDLCTAWM